LVEGLVGHRPVGQLFR